MSQDCLFCRLINREIPTDIIYEDEFVFVFKDISPKAPVHLLIIPKIHISSPNEINQLDKNTQARLLSVLPDLAKQFNIDKTGYRTITNCGPDTGQEIDHLHVHLLGGKKFSVFV